MKAKKRVIPKNRYGKISEKREKANKILREIIYKEIMYKEGNELKITEQK